MQPGDRQEWLSGYDQGIDDAIRIVDAMRGPGTNNLSSPILLRLRAELLAIRHRGESERKAA